MASILSRELFPAKHVPQMASALSTLYFHPHFVCVWYLLDCPGEMVIKRWPSTTRVKFGGRGKEGVVTPSAHISSSLVIVIVLTRKWSLCPLVLNHVLFCFSELIPFHS